MRWTPAAVAMMMLVASGGVASAASPRIAEPPAAGHAVFASSDVPIAIPDDDPSGLTSRIDVAAEGDVVDLDLGLRIDHTRVGDLRVMLTHVETGTSVLVIDRPGRPVLGALGCWEEDIEAVLDDEVATPVEEECLPDPPAIGGRFFPNHPLSAFDGEPAAGEWLLSVSDEYEGRSGTLVEWEIHVQLPDPEPTVTCNGLAATIVGSPGFDVLVGTEGADVIVGMGGGDEIRAGAGDDTICAGPGDSMIEGGPGDDWIDGGPGDDTVTYEGAPAGVAVDLGAGFATGGDGADTLARVRNIIGSRHSDVLAGNAFDNVIEGLAGDDRFNGKKGADVLIGGVGDDVFQGRQGDDRLDGGTGSDAAAYVTAGAAVEVDLTLGNANGDGADILFGIEDVFGSRHDDLIIGSAKANLLIGAKGDDTLVGNGSDDTLRGKQGDDSLDGGSGDDRLLGGSGTDTADGGPGNDVCFAETTVAC